MATSSKSASRPAARLDASLLLARKGEAAPAVTATQHNNPGLAWGAAPHPEDFQNHKPQPQPQPHAHHSVPPVPRTKPHASSARLRSDTFVGGRTERTSTHHRPDMRGHHADDVALTLRLEDEIYLRLKYLAQKTGMSTQKILADALSFHLVRKGVPNTKKMTIKSE